MRRILFLLTVVFCAGGAVQPLLAQKTAPQITRDSDRDGIPEPRDRCPRTPPNTRIDVNGCPDLTVPSTTPAVLPPAVAGTPTAPTAVPAPPTTAAQPRPDTTRPRPTGLPAPASATSPPVTPPVTGAPTGAPVGAPRAAVNGNQPVTQSAPASTQANTSSAAPPPVRVPVTVPVPVPVPVTVPVTVPVAPSRAAPPPAVAPPPAASTDPTETAGFWIPVYNGRSDADQSAYVRQLVSKVDSAVIALVETYRNTTGNPVPGADNPNRLTRREKDRWLRCRNIAYDFRTMAEAAGGLRESVVGGPLAQRAMAGLAGAFEELQALDGCDVITSMIDSPDRFNPWMANYEAEARNFYRDWYAQLRAVHSAARDVARAARFPMPAAISTTPPYVTAR